MAIKATIGNGDNILRYLTSDPVIGNQSYDVLITWVGFSEIDMGPLMRPQLKFPVFPLEIEDRSVERFSTFNNSRIGLREVPPNQ